MALIAHFLFQALEAIKQLSQQDRQRWNSFLNITMMATSANSMHHVLNCVEFTARFGLRPLNNAITHTLSFSFPFEKYSDKASSLSFVFVVVPNIFTSSAKFLIRYYPVLLLYQTGALVHQSVHLR